MAMITILCRPTNVTVKYTAMLRTGKKRCVRGKKWLR